MRQRHAGRPVGLGFAAVLTAALFTAGCAADDPLDAFSVDVIVDGLDRPTQFAVTVDGWYVAQLNGGEDDGTGEVIRLDPGDLSAAPTVIVDGLVKPTGVAVFAGELWVMEERRLTRGPLEGGERTVVLDDLAYNGRSQGTLTVDGDRLLFDTSGSTRIGTGPGGTPTDTSGTLWAIDSSGEISNLGWGFKHAYAHVRDDAGVLWVTEMSDGRFDGERPADEVVAFVDGANHGWPSCVGDNRAVAESGIDTPCDGVPRSQATFAPGATPTGLAVAPWDPEALVVALWLEQRVVAISADPADAGSAATLVTDEILRPQHLVRDGDRLLVSDHESGTIVAIQR